MPFEVGDTVEIIANTLESAGSFIGQYGIVAEVCTDLGDVPYIVHIGGNIDRRVCFREDELKKTQARYVKEALQ